MTRVISIQNFGTYFRCMHAYEKVEVGQSSVANNHSSMAFSTFSSVHCFFESKNIVSLNKNVYDTRIGSKILHKP